MLAGVVLSFVFVRMKRPSAEGPGVGS